MGGSERHLLTLLPALERRGIDVRLAVLKSAGAEVFLAEVERQGIDHIILPAGGHLNPTLPTRLYRAIRAFKPDLVHTHLIHADLYGQVAARGAGRPAVSTLHGTGPHYEGQSGRLAAAMSGHLARLVIAPSQHVASFATERRLVPAQRLRVVPHGLDPSQWSPSARQRSSARDRLGVNNNEVLVVITSRLAPLKGHDFFLKAFAAAAEQAPNLRCLIAGDGPLRDALAVQASVLPEGRVLMAGHIHDVGDVLAAADIVVVPTSPELSEGFGLSALEGMFYSRPVIITRTGALPELIVDGVSGIVCSYGDISSLADALIRLAIGHGLRREMGELAAQRARRFYSIDAMVERTIDVYREAVRRDLDAI